MVKESIEQNSNPNTTWTFQDNSKGIVHQEDVATEKQADAENRSVLAEEKPVVNEAAEGSFGKEKIGTSKELDDVVRSSYSDNKIAHESGQTTTVDATSNSEQ